MPQALYPRHIRPDVVDALTASRAVAVLGARQVGKSTLVAQIASDEHPARLISLDDEATATAARTDPTGFIADIDERVAIDEIQRAPEVLLAIKRRLDADRTRGQFLLTGSANILSLPTVADALPGRVEYVTLWPLSQGEMRDVRERFIDGLFDARHPRLSGMPVGRKPIATTLAAGGFPEAQDRTPRQRTRFFSSYIASIIGRDLDDIANVRNLENIQRLLYVIAASFSQAGWDVRTPDGERIQVKSIRTTRTTKRKNLSPIRDREYDSVVVVVFDEEFQIPDALKLSREVAEDSATHNKHVNGHILYLNRLLADPRVEHIDLADAYARLNS